MSTNRDFDRIAGAWLAEGPSELADRVLEAALNEIHLTHQRHRAAVPWRTPTLNTRLRLAAGIAIIVVVGVGALTYVGGGPGVGSVTPTSPTLAPTATPAPSAEPTVTPSPSGTPFSFTSPLYRYTVTVPAGWVVTAATIPWQGRSTPASSSLDAFRGPPANPDFDDVYVASQRVPDGMTHDAWMLWYAETMAASSRDCKGPVDAWTEADVGPLAIRRIDLECEGIRLSDVVFVVENRGHLMTGNRDAIALFLNTFVHGEIFGTGYPTDGGLEGVDPALDSFQPG